MPSSLPWDEGGGDLRTTDGQQCEVRRMSYLQVRGAALPGPAPISFSVSIDKYRRKHFTFECLIMIFREGVLAMRRWERRKEYDETSVNRLLLRWDATINSSKIIAGRRILFGQG
mmetsp:Transcript_8106/g.18629  ORF Transcript_8106/g.18629 Transcript_8106/m.18629 type:complete len:115 (-) Transcript_8106:387-731(-)